MRLHDFGLFIKQYVSIKDPDERLTAASGLHRIISPDLCHVVRIDNDIPETLYREVFVNSGELPDFSEIAGLLTVAEQDQSPCRSVTIRDREFHVALFSFYSGNTVYGHVLFAKNTPFDPDDCEMLSIFQNLLRITNERSAVEVELQEKNREYKSEIHKIRTIQVSLMPHFDEIRNFDIASAYLPAKDLSGDFFDAFFIGPDTYQIVLCDVSGHGIASSYVGNELRALYKVTSRPGRGPAEIARIVNNASVHDLDHLYYFSTVVICQLTISTGEIRYTNAGHPEMILQRNNGSKFISLPQTGPLIGLFKDRDFGEESIIMKPGDCLFLYTDGITEASREHSSGEREFFGTGRLSGIIDENHAFSSRDILHFVISTVYDFTDYSDQEDDMTALCIKRT